MYRSERNYAGECSFRLEHREKKQGIKDTRFASSAGVIGSFLGLLLPFYCLLTALRGDHRLDKNKKGPSQLTVTTALAMSGRLDSNQRPPEPHSAGRFQKGPFFRAFSQSAVSSYYEFYED
jgi:hypothetical protein